MKNIKSILQILLPLLLLSGCCDEDEYIYIPEENKILYELHDTLVYKSNEGELDTFFVSDTLRSFDEAPNYDYCGTATYREQYKFEIEKCPNESNMNFYIRYIVNDVDMMWFSSHFGFNLTKQSTMDSLAINNKVYFNIYSESSSEDNAAVQTLYYHKKHGIVKYIDIHDKSWFLFKILKHNKQ